MADQPRKLSLAVSVEQLRSRPIEAMESVKQYLDNGWHLDGIEFKDKSYLWTFIKGGQPKMPSRAAHDYAQVAHKSEEVHPLGWAYDCAMRWVYTWWSNNTVTRYPVTGNIGAMNGEYAIVKPISPTQQVSVNADRQWNPNDFLTFHPYEAAQ